MPKHKVLEYKFNYSPTSESLWNHYKDERYDVDDDASDGKSFKHRRKITEKKPCNTSTT